MNKVKFEQTGTLLVVIKTYFREDAYRADVMKLKSGFLLEQFGKDK